MGDYRGQGYLATEARAQAERDRAAAVRLEEYQRAFFGRAERDAAPSPLDGAVAERVANARRREWMDPWGARGIAPLVLEGLVSRLVHQARRPPALLTPTARLARTERVRTPPRSAIPESESWAPRRARPTAGVCFRRRRRDRRSDAWGEARPSGGTAMAVADPLRPAAGRRGVSGPRGKGEGNALCGDGRGRG